MRRWSLFCVSTAFAALLAAQPGQAQSMSPADVTTMLAKSHAIDTRCNILADADAQDLMDFLARAEILLAEKASVKTAQAAIAKGKAEAASAACGPEQDKLVRGVLAAARASTQGEPPTEQAANTAPRPAPPAAAVAAAPVPEPAEQPTAQDAAPALKPTIVADAPAAPDKAKPVKAAAAKKKEPAVTAEKVAVVKKKTKPVAKPTAKGTNSLNSYASLAARYYTELKCRNMSGAAVRRLYSTVLSSHRQAVAENGAPAVRSILRTAEARANASSCG